MTEESVETLYALGKEDLIVGVSAFVKRPLEAQKKKKISAFTSANIPKIQELKPDLILGFSDIQKDIARDLIGLGFNVFISNHRSLEETLSYILTLGSLVGEREKTLKLIDHYEKLMEKASTLGQSLKKRPRVYLEEWDDPMICGISWFSELVSLCGGEDICQSYSKGILAKDRFISTEYIKEQNPDIIFGCWCGKKVNIASIKEREGWHQIKAVKNNQVFELAPEIFLQPGPSLFVDGPKVLATFFEMWDKNCS
ncbi:MAG: ABC transporter substrate-binding protein [Bdellovibrionota bacterium]|nr:ABC transporter substrate-binding protein [Bdellovibrionota bacterium]